MSELDPGAGWRRLSTGEDAPDPIAPRDFIVHYDSLGAATRWVRDGEPEQTEFWEVQGGIGGQRVACDLPSRAAAEKVADGFAKHIARLDVPQTPTRVVRQAGRYGRQS